MKIDRFILFLLFCLINIINRADGRQRNIPSNLLFGVSTSAYQIEGGWNASDKGENIWDRLTHTTKLIKDRSTGNIACDSYHQVENDIKILKELGVNFYRFSFSWSRLLPTGFDDKISVDGSAYYNKLIDGLIAAGITPIGTIYHWDLPQSIQDLGGWLNSSIVQHFTRYANITFKLYGDRIKTWLTINEPWIVCVEGYGGKNKAPALGKAGTGDYVCGHNIIKAHASTYHLYDQVYRSTQKGRIGLSLNANWVEPATQKPSDIEAAEILLNFTIGWFSHPIFSNEGDYPQTMKDNIGKNSRIQGFKESRLPKFTKDEINWIKGSSDFLGLNHYTTVMAKSSPSILKPMRRVLNYYSDVFVVGYQNPTWPNSASFWLKVVPWGFGKLLRWIKNTYSNPEVYVTENGFSDKGNINDDSRINYYKTYINSMLDAIEDGCKVSAYTAWSLMDNFEWMEGYTEHFGLYRVNFSDPKRTRVAKKSAAFYRDVIASKTIEHVKI